MSNLIKIILRYHFFLLFLTLEIVAFLMIINHNDVKKERFVSSANLVSGYFYTKYSGYVEYFNLRDQNRILASELSRLRNQSLNSFKYNETRFKLWNDSTAIRQFEYMPVRVVKNSIHRNNNHITINAGSRMGIEPDMAVIGPSGVVGVVREVSENFATVISLLNVNFNMSARLSQNDYFGTLNWDGQNPDFALLGQIPNHADVKRGDTLLTNGYSFIFPPNINVGFVDSTDVKQGDSFYEIRVRLATNFRKLTHVFVVRNVLRNELLELEEMVEAEN